MEQLQISTFVSKVHRCVASASGAAGPWHRITLRIRISLSCSTSHWNNFLFKINVFFQDFPVKFCQNFENFENFNFCRFFGARENSFAPTFTCPTMLQCGIWPARNLRHTKLFPENKFNWKSNGWSSFKFQFFFQKCIAVSQVCPAPLDSNTVLFFEYKYAILLYKYF